jgi:hypothetical protein
MATLISLSQEAENQAVITRVYDGDDFGSYYLDPPYWSYQPKRFWSRKSAHWFYKKSSIRVYRHQIKSGHSAPLDYSRSSTLGSITAHPAAERRTPFSAVSTSKT